jgi:hypothetical protein
MKAKLKLVSAADQTHFLSLLQLLCSIKRTKKIVGDIEVEIWDLGLVESQIEFLKRYFGDMVSLRKFEFEHYPPWMDVKINAGEYAWKPNIIELSLTSTEETRSADCLIWIDAGNIIDMNIVGIHNFLEKGLLYSPTSSGVVSDWTHQKTIEYDGRSYWRNYEIFKNFPCRNGAVLGFNIKNDLVKKFVALFAKLSREKACIAPSGSSRLNHRQDQSLFTLLYYEFVLANATPVVNEYYGFTIHNDIDDDQP